MQWPRDFLFPIKIGLFCLMRTVIYRAWTAGHQQNSIQALWRAGRNLRNHSLSSFGRRFFRNWNRGGGGWRIFFFLRGMKSRMIG